MYDTDRRHRRRGWWGRLSVAGSVALALGLGIAQPAFAGVTVHDRDGAQAQYRTHNQHRVPTTASKTHGANRRHTKATKQATKKVAASAAAPHHGGSTNRRAARQRSAAVRAFAETTTAPGVTRYTIPGGPYPYTVPAGITTLHVHTVGGRGGAASAGTGGYGAVVDVDVDLAVTPGQTLYAYVAGNGANGTAGAAAGGTNGGGTSSAGYAGGGGGESDVRTSTGDLETALLVAAGGGGSGWNATGGDAGQPGGVANCGEPEPATPGTATTGGSGGTDPCDGSRAINAANGGFGTGGAGGYRNDQDTGGGGGGAGWYGGGGGGAYSGGAGGSNHVPSGATTGIDSTGVPEVEFSVVALTAAFDTPSVERNTVTTLTMTVSRAATDVPATGIGFQVGLPAGLTVAGTSSSTTCGGTLTAPDGGSTVNLNDATLLTGDAGCQVSVPVTAPHPGTFTLGDTSVTAATGVANAIPSSDGPTLTVIKTPQMITFAAVPDTPMDGTVTLDATAGSGLPITFTSDTTDVCTVNGTAVTLVSLGTCHITASQAGDADWSAATDITRTFAVTAATVPNAPRNVQVTAGVASLTVSWDPPADNGAPITGYTASASPGPAECTVTQATSCVLGAVAGTPYTVTVVAHAGDVTSAPSSMSESITPTAPPVPDAPPVTTATLTTDKGTISTVTPGESVTVLGTGFAAYSTAKVAVYSTPTELAAVTTDANGAFAAAVTIPTTLAAGSHSLVALGVDPGGTTRTLRLDITVPSAVTTAATSATDLPKTGVAINQLITIGLGLLIAGGGLRTVVRPRRRRTRSVPG